MRPQQHWEAPGSVQTQSTRSAAATERNAARLDRLCVCEGPGASLHALSDGESSHEDLSREDLSRVRTSLPGDSQGPQLLSTSMFYGENEVFEPLLLPHGSSSKLQVAAAGLLRERCRCVYAL